MSEPLPPTLVTPPLPGSQGSSTEHTTAPLFAEQRQNWERGQRLRVEDVLNKYPELRNSPPAVLGLILNEISLRRERGENVSELEYRERFPHLASQLGANAPTEQETLQQGGLSRTMIAPESQAAGTLVIDSATPRIDVRPPTPSGPGAPRMLGDYMVQGVLGRGGMGVVYKAWQLRLNRFVALKMIIGGGHVGEEEQARFQIEAEAAARLQHPNIVQIFEIGKFEERPYFALEFVEGGTLASRLDGTPQPPRAAARLVETLAKAMHHAHQRGVVHRDLKPGNILLAKGADLGPDDQDYGMPKITDFGLAKRLDIDLKQTQTGAILGTPSYMAPEQASGRIRAIGPETDVYALGAILYDMLTGRPPFKASTLADTLQQVQNTDPVAPVRLAPQIPRDLETICLKCLRKEPDKRYATAQELADDLHRFLASEPIEARPTPAWERLWKWAQRRPAAAALAGVSILAAFTIFAGALWSNAALRASAKREESQRVRAEANFRQALSAVDQMLTEVGAVELQDIPQMEPVRKKLLQQAQVYYQTFLSERGDDPEVRQEAARAQGRLGDILAMLKDSAQAEQAYTQALTLLRDLPADSKQQAELGKVLNNYGLFLRETNDRYRSSAEQLQQALAIRTGLVQASGDEPGFQRDLASTRYNLGTVLARLPGKRADARQAYLEALDVQEKLTARFPDQPDYRRDRARTLNNLGILLTSVDRADEAEKSFDQAVGLQQALVQRWPAVAAYRRELAESYNNRAFLFWKGGKRLGADQDFHQAVDILRRLVLDFPSVPEYPYVLASVYRTRGELLQDAARSKESEAVFRESAKLLQELTSFSTTPKYRRQLAAVYVDLGTLLEREHRPAEAEKAYRAALASQQALVNQAPELAAYRSDLGSTLNQVAGLLFTRSQLGEPRQGVELIMGGALANPIAVLTVAAGARGALLEARKTLEDASVQGRMAWTADPDNAEYRKLLREQYYNLALICVRLRDHEAVARAAEELPPLSPDDYTEYACAAEFLARCVSMAIRDGNLGDSRRRDLVEKYSQRSIALLRESVRHGFKNSQELRTLPVYTPLRQREDFKRLLEDLEGKSATGVG